LADIQTPTNFENIVRRIVTMSIQTPELNTASGNTNVGNDNIYLE